MREWRAIADLDGYEVSNDGQVRAHTRKIWIGPSHDGRKEYERSRAGRVLQPQRQANGYLAVRLPPGRTVQVHRLVCRAFNGAPPAPDCHAHHINGQRDYNRAENLVWLEPKANRALRCMPRGEHHGMHKLTAQQVKEIRLRSVTPGGRVTRFDNMVATEYGVTRETIRNIRRGKSWLQIAEVPA